VERTMKQLERYGAFEHVLLPIKLSGREAPNLYLPEAVWGNIQNELKEKRMEHPEALAYLLRACASQRWSLEKDPSAERVAKQGIQDKIPTKLTHVEAGAQIVNRGEKVTKRHIAMVHAMKNALMQKRNPWTPLAMLGSLCLSTCILLASVWYLRAVHKELLDSFRKMTLLVLILMFSMAFAKFVEYVLLYEGRNITEIVRFPVLIPFASLLTSILLGSEIAMAVSFFLSVIFGMTLAVDKIPFLLFNLYAAIFTILFARVLHKRKQVFTVLLRVWLCCIPLIFAYNLSLNTFWNINLFCDSLSLFAMFGGTALLAIGCLPVFESLFGVMTDMTLMEYMDPNTELLKRLSMEIPGTYQHSIVVGHLAEAAARSIGANDLFCRVAALYHDIGKLNHPHYFTENQFGALNIHPLLTPVESAAAIIAHVPDGEFLARKYRLPRSFIDIIREHHGTTLVYYFYRKELDLVGEKIQTELFRYPGPKPRTKESAILMIADTIEAASRSCEQTGEEAMQAFVDKLVGEKVMEGQLDQCALTFEELGRVKKAITKALVIAHHARIRYPEKLLAFSEADALSHI
jgi:cyclic-di-AMP phosphodiesterase PgpH